jgi:non-ribosomal peptide synthetase component F
LWIIEGARAIHAGWLYRTDLFEEEDITRMHGHLEALLSSIVARPDAPLDELEMLGEAERARQNTNRVIREESDYRRFKSMKPRAVTRSED